MPANYQQIADKISAMEQTGELTPEQSLQLHQTLSTKGYGPGVPRPAVPGLNADTPDNFFTSPNGLVRSGLDRAYSGLARTTRPGADAKLKGAAEVIKGVGSAALPVAIPFMAAAPIATALGFAGGAVGDAAGSYAADKLALPEGSGGRDMLELAGGAVGGGVGMKYGPSIPRGVWNGVKATGSGVGNMADAWATRRTDPIPDMVRAIKPRAVKTNFKQALETAAPEIKAAEPALGRKIGGRYKDADVQPGHGIEDTLAATKIAKERLWNNIQKATEGQNAMGLQIDLTPLGRAEAAAIPKHIAMENPELYARMQAEAIARWQGKSASLKEADALLHDYNAQLRGEYASFPPDQRAALISKPHIASLDARAEATRQAIYGTLERNTGTPAVRNAMKRYGSLMEVERELYPRLNVETRQNPDSLSEQVSKWSSAAKALKGAITGNPADVVEAGMATHAAKWIKDSNKADTILRRAFSKYDGKQAPFQMPAPFKPAGLLEAGPRRMGGMKQDIPIDAAGNTRRVPGDPMPQWIQDLRNVGRYPERLALPPASSQIGVSGTTVPDILGRSPRGKGGPVGLLSAPQPGQPPLNILPTGPGAIGPAGTVPELSYETPYPLEGELGGGLLDGIRYRGIRQ